MDFFSLVSMIIFSVFWNCIARQKTKTMRNGVPGLKFERLKPNVWLVICESLLFFNG